MGVSKMLCVGCTLEDSKLGIEFAKKHNMVWASVGIHPHEAKKYAKKQYKLDEFENIVRSNKVVAIGEAGLDFYYKHSPKAEQIELLHFQMSLAKKYNLPMIFHVREAFDDFWPIYDDYKVPGVIHSFTATKKELKEALTRELYIGLNGIMTFTKDKDQLEAAKTVPLSKLLLETDAPFLTPVPYRGIICQPKHVVTTAEFLAKLRKETIKQIASATTTNAEKLFTI